MAETYDTGSSAKSKYKRYRPEMYPQHISIFWWVKKKPYVLFIVRELTSLFVAAYAIVIIFQLNALSKGPEAWETLLAFFTSPLSIVLHVVILAFVVFHSITWFNLAPTAMVLRIGKKRIPGSAIIIMNFLMWIVLSIAITWIIVTV